MVTDDEIDRAYAAADEAERREPRAKAVRYDPERELLEITLRNDVTVVVPRALLPQLRAFAPEQLRNAEVSPASGRAIRWDAIDMDISVPGLLHRLIGSPPEHGSIAADGMPIAR